MVWVFHIEIHIRIQMVIKMQSFRPSHTEIQYKNLKFLITDKPTDNTLNDYIKELKQRNVCDVVRVCEGDYSTDQLMNEGINVHDWYFDDGTLPPQNIINSWFDLIMKRIKESHSSSHQSSHPSHCIAVHCVAGLGRAPVLVALALIEAGMKYEDAVEMIRQQRRGAINSKQLNFLANYKPKNKFKDKKSLKCSIT